MMLKATRYIDWHRTNVEAVAEDRRSGNYKIVAPPGLQISADVTTRANVPLPKALAVAPRIDLDLCDRFMRAMFIVNAPGKDEPQYSDVRLAMHACTAMLQYSNIDVSLQPTASHILCLCS